MIFSNFKPYAACACAVALVGIAVAPAAAQSVLAYPQKGQSAEQIKKDEFECQMWAMERTGFSPRQPPPRSTASVSGGGSYGSRVDPTTFGSGETGQGGTVADGARGAAIGAIGGAIAGHAGKGAAWGALGGAVFGGMKRNQRKQQEADWQRQQQMQQQQQQQQKQQHYQQKRHEFDSATGLCMESRDYNVQY